MAWTIAWTSPGKQAWSPVYSTTSTGWRIDGAVLASEAFDDRADHVDNQLSGVHWRANPTAPKLDAKGSEPHREPNLRSDGCIGRSKQRRSASVRQTLMIGVWAAARWSSAEAEPPWALTRLRADMRRSII